MRKIFIIFCFLVLVPSLVWAAARDVTCSDDITVALQGAIDASADTDIVNILAGSCSATAVSWTNKNITVQGQGIGTTTVSGLSITVTTTTKADWRITGISMGAGIINIRSDGLGTSIKGWRIDHLAFAYSGCTQNIAVQIYGQSWGLIDNCTFSGAGNAIFLTGYTDAETTQGFETSPWPPDGDPGMGGMGWGLTLNQGSDEAVYVEDNTFTMGTGCYYGIGDMYYGSRMVFRYNTVTNAYWQNHACRSYERGGNAWAEIYNNDFNATDIAWSRAVHIRSGSGVVYNNTIRGYFTQIQADNQRSDGGNTQDPYGACDGSKAWDGNVTGGWPCLDQIGRAPGVDFGETQTSAPLYVWNNGSDAGCHTGGACNNSVTMTNVAEDAAVLADRDYINNGTTAKPGYTALTYPHPDQGVADTTAPTVSITTSDPSAISSDALTATGTASDAVGVSSCKYRLGSAPDASNGTACTGTTAWSCSTSGYSEGANTLYVGCTDAAGNWGSDSITVNYTITPASTASCTGQSLTGVSIR